MPKFVSDAGAYLKAVFTDGIQKLFTLFDALGVLIFLSPSLSEWVSVNGSIARTVGGIVVLASFLVANFSLYRKLAGHEPLGSRMNEVQGLVEAAFHQVRTQIDRLESEKQNISEKSRHRATMQHTQEDLENVSRILMQIKGLIGERDAD
jgi:hypothetical protein